MWYNEFFLWDMLEVKIQVKWIAQTSLCVKVNFEMSKERVLGLSTDWCLSVFANFSFAFFIYSINKIRSGPGDF